jgi:glycosyltransferase involved in cell wall biosynthesis
MTSCSDVVLPEDAFVEKARPLAPRIRQVQLVTVGDVNQLYKAPHILLEAVAVMAKAGRDVMLTHVGKGAYLPWLRERAERHGIADRVTFTGRLPGGAPVRKVLDDADLFVLPSFQEGLPRAMVEAMARGLPCVGSRVGGIGELLVSDDMVAPGHAAGLAEKIVTIVDDPRRMAEMSARNLRRARCYRGPALQARRRAFYRLVREATARRLPAGQG